MRFINIVKRRFSKLALGLTALAFPAAMFLSSGAAAATPTFTVSPWTYGPTNCPGEVANWDNSMGDPSPSLHLTKPCPTPSDAATGATVNNVNGIKLSELDFEYLTAGHCGAGAPRYNVYTNAGYYFFGCTSGTHTTSVTNAAWTHVEFTNADAFPATATTPAWPGFGNVTITGIDVVMDEGNDTSATQGSPGDTHLDNFSINNQTVSGVNTPTNKNDCKNNGFTNFTDEDGMTFTNQGQCVSFVNGNRNSHRNNTRVRINTVNNQSATSGNANSNNNTTGGNANSGNATNNNSNTNNVNVNNGSF